MRVSRPRPRLLFNEDEQAIYDNYLAAYHKEYPNLTVTDSIQLEDAATYHILNLRLMGEDLVQNKGTWNTRFNPKMLELKILEDLSARRKDRVLPNKQTSGETEDERLMRETLLSIGVPVNRR